MAIRYRLADAGAASTTHVVPLTDGAGKVPHVGDRVVVGFVNDVATNTATPSTGWEDLGSQGQSTGTNHRMTLFTRALDGGANDTLTVTLAEGQEAQWCVICSVGDAGAPAAPVFNNGAAATTATVGAIAGLTSGDYDSVIFIGLDNGAGTQHTFILPAGWLNFTPPAPQSASEVVLCHSMDNSRTGVTGFTPGDITFTNAEQWITGHVAIPSAVDMRRFYLVNQAPEFSPGEASSFWDDTAAALAVPQLLGETPTGASTSTAVAENSGVADWWVLLGQWTSLPASAPGTLGSWFRAVAALLESNPDAEFQPVVTAYVLVGDSTTRRGTAISRFAVDIEFPTTAAGVEYTDSDDLVAVDFLAEDRIVVEIGFRATNVHTNSRTGTLYRGGTTTPDLAGGATDVTRPGWIELPITPGVAFEDPAGIDVQLGRAESAEAARPLTATKTVTLGRAASLEVARPVEAFQGFGTGRATAVEVARPLAVSKTVTLGRPVAVESAFGLVAAELPGVPFLIRELGGAARLLVEVAWGADPAGDPDDWTWTDITRDVRAEPGISTKAGRDDEAATSQPASCSMVLRNDAHAYSLGGHSPNWPNVTRNVPVRVRVDPDGAGFETAFIGHADGWTPGWHTTGRIPTVTLSASGTMRRLLQGDAPVTSAYRRDITNDASVVAYWPFEDQRNATYARAVRGGSNMVTASTHHEFGADSPFDCSAPLVRLRSSPDGTFEDFGATLDPYPVTGRTQVRWLMALPRQSLPNGAFLCDVFTDGTLGRISVTYADGTPDDVDDDLPLDGLHLTTWDGDNNVITENTVDFGILGATRLFGLDLTQDGDDATVRLITYIPGDPIFTFFTVNLTDRTIGQVTSLFMGGNDVDDVVMGHVTVANAFAPQGSAALSAFVGEFPTGDDGRLRRLGQENAVPVRVLGSTATRSLNDTLGPQLPRPLMELMRECESADQGQLFDGLFAPGLVYTTRRFRELGTVAVTIDAAAAELADPFSPADDDQRNRNRVEATITTGVTAAFEDVAGPLGTDTIGMYDSSFEANNQHDDMAIHYAAWRVHTGTVEGYRVGSVTVDLRAAPQLARAVLEALPGHRIDITNVDQVAQGWLPGGIPLSLIIEGIAHDIGPRHWHATFTCSPFSPWGVAQVAAETGDTNPLAWRLDTDGTRLVGDHPAGSTALVVSNEPATLATDTFTRTVAGGWGTADLGGDYVTSGSAGVTPADFSVGAGVGTMVATAAGHSQLAYLPDVDARDVDVAVTCTCSAIDITGGDLELANVIVRGKSLEDYFYARVIVLPNQSVWLSIVEKQDDEHTDIAEAAQIVGLTFTGTVRCRIQAVGRTLRARVWDPSGAEPTGWQREVVVGARSGWVGARTRVADGVTNPPPITFTFDDFTATAIDPPGGPLWTTDPDDYPLTLSVGGLPVVATACTGATSPQTFTVQPLPLARVDGVPVRLWDPRPIGL